MPNEQWMYVFMASTGILFILLVWAGFTLMQDTQTIRDLHSQLRSIRENLKDCQHDCECYKNNSHSLARQVTELTQSKDQCQTHFQTERDRYDTALRKIRIIVGEVIDNPPR